VLGVIDKNQVPFWFGMPLTLIFMFAFGIAIQILICGDDRRADQFR